MGLSDSEKILMIYSAVLIQSTHVTDGCMDGQSDKQTDRQWTNLKNVFWNNVTNPKQPKEFLSLRYYRVRQNKVSPNVSCRFLSNHLGILVQNFAHLLLVYIHITVP